METTNFTEKESLELITNMINSTRKNMSVGSGNIFLYYGYFTTLLAFVLYLPVYFTGHPIWNVGWLLMFVFWGIMSFLARRKKQKVITFLDKAIAQVWQVTGWVFLLTFGVIIVVGLVYGTMNFSYMLPLSLLYCSIASSITGLVIKERWTTILPLIGVAVALFLLLTYSLDRSLIKYWNLLFGCSFIFIMIIPGYILNRKAGKRC